MASERSCLNGELFDSLEKAQIVIDDSIVQATIVECPRDAWQGLPRIIPTEEKIRYLKRLISLGFRHIDAVSFVSAKHVPQMADSEAVMKELSQVRFPGEPALDIIGIVVNAQGL